MTSLASAGSASTDAASGRRRSALALSGVLLLALAAGCQLLPPGGLGGSAPPDPLEEYAERVKTATAVVAVESGGVSFDSGSGRGATIASRFASELDGYRADVAAERSSWDDLDADSLQRLAERTIEREAELRALADELAEWRETLDGSAGASTPTDAASGRVPVPAPEPGVDGGTARGPVPSPGGEGGAPDWLALQRILEEAPEQVRSFHAARLSHASRAPHPSALVLDFMVLEKLAHPRLERHGRAYRRALGEWCRARAERGGPADALAVVALGFTESPRHAPDSLRDLALVSRRSLDDSPGHDELERMERDLARIASAWRDLHGDDARRELEIARGVLDLSRARLSSDPAYGMQLATEAARRDPSLEEPVRAFFLEAGQRLADRLAPEAQYAEAVASFERLVAGAGLRDAGNLATRFREHVFHRATSHFDRALDAARYLEARRVLASCARLARGPGDREALEERLHDFYVQYAWSLEQTAPEEHLAVCQEMLRSFPRDATARAMVDRARLRRLEHQLGEVRTSHRRFDAREVLRMFRETAGQITTDAVVTACQRLLVKIQRTWRHELARERDPDEALRLSRELARLAGWSDGERENILAPTLERIARRAGASEDWGRLDRALVAWASGCSGRTRSTELRDLQVRLVARLDATGEVERLGRQVRDFVDTFPERRAVVESIIERRLAEGDSSSFARVFGSGRGAGGADELPERAGAAASLEPAIAGSAPAAVRPLGAEGSGARSVAPPARARGTPSGSAVQSRAAGVALAVSGVVTVLLHLALGLWTLRKGVCRFWWYGAAAFCLGATIGSALAL